MNNPFSLEGKHILITGASSGIGRQCAISCSEMGAKVTLVARNIVRLQETLEQMHNTNHWVISQDISDFEAIPEVIAIAVANNGKVDGFVHCAGIEGTMPINLVSKNVLENYFELNVYAGFEFIKYLAKKKNSNFPASFILLASVMSVVGEPGKTAYCASKGAVISGARALALELSSKSIRVNCLSPGIVETPMTLKAFKELPESTALELNKRHFLGFGSPVDVANAAVYLLSDASKWVTGINLIVDGGYCAR